MGRNASMVEGKIQMRLHVDVIMQFRPDRCVAIEEKIVRYPGYVYTAMAVETHARLRPDDDDAHGDGWIWTSHAEFLLYAFVQEDGSLRVWVFNLPRLRHWFRNQWHVFESAYVKNVGGLTVVRKVPLQKIPRKIVHVRDKVVR